MSAGVKAAHEPDSVPRVAVIVPTRNRASTLPTLLEALERQDLGRESFEVIVVDNSSTDGTAALMQDWQTKATLSLRYFVKDNRGPAASRNYGAARARGEVLAFTDSDCIPRPTWLSSGVQSLDDGAGIVCGPITVQEPSFLDQQIGAATRDDGLYPTANLIVRRAAFEAVGGFDERLGIYAWGGVVGGEDTDLAWRLKRTGARAVFNIRTEVHHQALPLSLGQWMLRPMLYRSIPMLVRRIPELRETLLWHRYFGGKDHFFFHVAWLGVAAAALTRQWLLIMFAVPWAWMVFHLVWPRVRRGRIDLAGAVFLLTLYRYFALSVALLMGSVTARRLVL